MYGFMSVLEQGRRIVERVGEGLGIARKGLSPEHYRASLGTTEQMTVTAFEQFVKGLQGSGEFPDVKFALIAVGSTTRPEDKRHHPVRDIDLRILHSTRNDQLSGDVVDRLREIIRDFLRGSGFDFRESGSTDSLYIYPDGTRWMDSYNSDPSFVISGAGLPVHLCISGPGAYNLQDHLREERRCNTSFVLLV